MLLAIGIFVSVTLIGSVSGWVNPNWRCPSNATMHFRDYTNCGRYVTCYRGQVFSNECGRGLHFDVQRQVCDYPDNVDCNACPFDGITSIQTGCSNYRLCVFGNAIDKTCPPGSYFNLNDCTPGRECPFVPCQGFGQGVYFNRAPNCTTYYICLDGQEVGSRHCPGNFWFDVETDTCRGGIKPMHCRVDPIFDFSQIMPHNGVRDFYTCPTRGIASIGIRGNCQQYAICIDGVQFGFSCPDGTLYDVENQECVQADRVQCE
jgi:hypothetical protein